MSRTVATCLGGVVADMGAELRRELALLQEIEALLGAAGGAAAVDSQEAQRCLAAICERSRELSEPSGRARTGHLTPEAFHGACWHVRQEGQHAIAARQAAEARQETEELEAASRAAQFQRFVAEGAVLTERMHAGDLEAYQRLRDRDRDGFLWDPHDPELGTRAMRRVTSKERLRASPAGAAAESERAP